MALMPPIGGIDMINQILLNVIGGSVTFKDLLNESNNPIKASTMI